jgi:hypothetical protein
MAPPAFEGTAFEKDCSSNTWTIIDGVSLDIEYHSSGHGWLSQI